MTAATLTSGYSRRETSSFLGYVSAFFAGIRDGHAIASRYETLARLSDRQLAGLGLDRAGVPQAAARGVSA